MNARLRRLWRWVRAHVVTLPREPEITKSKTTDDSGVPKVGLRWWF